MPTKIKPKVFGAVGIGKSHQTYQTGQQPADWVETV